LALIDTHIWAWVLTDDPAIPPAIRHEIISSDHAISPISFYEIAQKVRMGKWRQMERFASDLPMIAQKTRLSVIPVEGEIAHLAGTLEWAHRDPFDRLIAATALVGGLQLISADTAFDSLIGLRRLW
jgi:PIN domain nuclease of toxin-antitoxin system